MKTKIFQIISIASICLALMAILLGTIYDALMCARGTTGIGMVVAAVGIIWGIIWSYAQVR